MVLSKMYCSEQIVIPEKISNLLKTYAKAALKTQPYDLLRWSAAYFRCLSMDALPPVKLRYENENMLGCLTKGYMKVLLSQVGKGFFVCREVLEQRWSELCLPEDELLKFLSLTRMLYWPQVHWLKLTSVMVGSINQNFHETMMMLFELLTDEPEGGASPIPLWIMRECFKYLAQLDCSEEQTFFDGRKVLSGNMLEDEIKMPTNIPQKLSSTSFRNAVIDFWKFRIENDEKVKSLQEEVATTSTAVTSTKDKICSLCTIPSTLRCGSEFNLSGAYTDPMHVIKNSNDFNDIIMVVKNLKCNDDDKVNELQTEVTETKISIEDDSCSMLRDIGPPWNWLHTFTSHNCHSKSYNFLEITSTPDDGNDDNESSDECIFSPQQQPLTSIFDDVQSTTSSVSIIHEQEVLVQPSNEHKMIVEAICNLSNASEQGECNIRETLSIASQLSTQHERKQLNKSDYERLKKFIDRAIECGLAFNDLNSLYNYFIQESSREQFSSKQDGINDADAEVENVIIPSSPSASASLMSTSAAAAVTVEVNKNELPAEADVESNENIAVTTSAATTTTTTIAISDSKNVVSIFGESGIEVDNRLLDAKVSDRMILGLVDKSQSEGDNVSDVPSSNASISSLSNAETVRMKDSLQVTREKDTQTLSYKDRVHEKRLQSGRKSVSASSISSRQPYTCKIPPLAGIGACWSDERIEKVLKFMANRSFEQGGFVYARNFLEDDCPSLLELN